MPQAITEDIQAPNFHPFERLPTEIRFRIWEDCLPPYPTVHFFDVIIHHQRRQSNIEFHVRATKEHDSGYLPVLALLASCREARAVVTAYYRITDHHTTNSQPQGQQASSSAKTWT